MNLRKFYFILTIVVSSVLFLIGVGILLYVNTYIMNSDTAYADLSNPVDQLFRPLMSKKEPFNVLLLGGDKVNKNSDTMMLANFDPATGKVNVMSIPRDTKVTIENKTHKINYAFPRGGIELTVKTVSELLDVNINYYAFVDTSAFREIIDLLGGVDYNIPADMHYDDPTQNLHIHLKKGHQNLNGAKAEQFVRFRHPNVWNKEIRKYYDGSDLKRMEAQQRFLKALAVQKLNLQYLPKLDSIIKAIFENVETNFSLSEVIKLTGYISKFKTDNLNFIPMPGTTYDASPWYYLCDIESSRKIIAESFPCRDGFVSANENAVIAYLNEKPLTKPKPAASDKSINGKNETGKRDITENNPSNPDSSITGTEIPEP